MRLHFLPISIQLRNCVDHYTWYSHRNGIGSQISNVPSFQKSRCVEELGEIVLATWMCEERGVIKDDLVGPGGYCRGYE